MRVAALTTNFGWSPGALVLNRADYARAWSTTQATALLVSTGAGTDRAALAGEIERALGPANGLEVLPQRTREAKMNGSVREGLGQLATISTLLILASILAMAAALASTIWQRRRSLAELKLSGVQPSRLRNLVMLESGLMLSVGALAGAAWGIYAQVALDEYLTSTTGFPVIRLGASMRPLVVLIVVIIVALAVSLLPTVFATRVPAGVALEE
jgi:putative ABC transport system permease protein